MGTKRYFKIFFMLSTIFSGQLSMAMIRVAPRGAGPFVPAQQAPVQPWTDISFPSMTTQHLMQMAQQTDQPQQSKQPLWREQELYPNQLFGQELFPSRLSGGAFKSTRPNLFRATPKMLMTRQEALDVLGLPEGASEAQITKAYQQMSMKYHPDLGGSEEQMQRLNEAIDVIDVLKQDSSSQDKSHAGKSSSKMLFGGLITAGAVGALTHKFLEDDLSPSKDDLLSSVIEAKKKLGLSDVLLRNLTWQQLQEAYFNHGGLLTRSKKQWEVDPTLKPGSREWERAMDAMYIKRETKKRLDLEFRHLRSEIINRDIIKWFKSPDMLDIILKYLNNPGSYNESLENIVEKKHLPIMEDHNPEKLSWRIDFDWYLHKNDPKNKSIGSLFSKSLVSSTEDYDRSVIREELPHLQDMLKRYHPTRTKDIDSAVATAYKYEEMSRKKFPW
jgi:curved DNA-binding protein CbpA